jgi:hypothetical protein
LWLSSYLSGIIRSMRHSDFMHGESLSDVSFRSFKLNQPLAKKLKVVGKEE